MAGRQSTLVGFFTEDGKVRPLHAPVPQQQHATRSGPTKLELPKPEPKIYTRDMEPWQVPRDIWLARHPEYEYVGIFLHCSPSQFAGMSKRAQRAYLRRNNEQRDKNARIEREHEDAVINAYFAGKPVPPEVLKDYLLIIDKIKKKRAMEEAIRIEESKPMKKSVHEFTGRKLKSDLGLAMARGQFSSVHKDGGGIFGYYLKTKKGDSFTLLGRCDSEGKITSMEIQPYGYGGAPPRKIPRDATYQDTLKIIKEYMEANS